MSVESGLIRFVPVGGTPGPSKFGDIVDGEFSMEGDGGLAEGTYRVEVTARAKTGRMVTQEFNGEQVEIEEEIAIGSPEYASDQSPLTVTVPGDQEQYNFDIPPA